MTISGVDLSELRTHHDERGSVTEIFREEWLDGRFVQWNHVRSDSGVLRGVHGHTLHSDYLVLLAGSALIGLKDLRPDSPTYGHSEIVPLRGDQQQSLKIPAGVAHGFYFPQPSVLVYAVTHYWNPEDELGCRWDDPELGIAWPFQSARVSARDAALPGFRAFAAELQEKMALRDKNRSDHTAAILK
jgi:dTDP-4-dehydrorhamnose 3,5-epimerase